MAQSRNRIPLRSQRVRWGWLTVSGGVVLLAASLAQGAEDGVPAILTKVLEISPGQTTYYVDPEAGNDFQSGTSVQKAWTSLERVCNVEFAPGDRILLKAGTVHRGKMHPWGSGAEGRPIVVDRYGEGADPQLDAAGWVTDTIRLRNQSHWTLRNLVVSNDTGNWGNHDRRLLRAVYVTAEDIGDVPGIHLENLTIRRVNGQYRGRGHDTNGGIICLARANAKATRFVDLRIEDCTFETASIDRYAVVVTSSGAHKVASEAVYRHNRLDHAGQAHIVIPPDQWPGKTVFYYDPEADYVFELPKDAPPISPKTGRVGCEDIFSETAARVKRSWEMFDATRFQEGHWLFKWRPEVADYTLDATAEYALATFGILRGLGFVPPWPIGDDTILDQWTREINVHLDPTTHLLSGPLGRHGNARGYYEFTLRCQVHMPERYQAPVESTEASAGRVKSLLTSKEEARRFLEGLPWATGPWGAGASVTHAAHGRLKLLIAQGKTRDEALHDENLLFVRQWLQEKFNAQGGYWGGENAGYNQRANGIMKLMVVYEDFDWPIPSPEKIVDFLLTGADQTRGFGGSGCDLFDPMYSLRVIRKRLPDYRADEIRRYTALSFVSFKNAWTSDTNWFGAKDWLGMHNLGAVTLMSEIILGHRYTKGSTWYNWRQAPMIKRRPDGTVEVNRQPIYQSPGQPFVGG